MSARWGSSGRARLGVAGAAFGRGRDWLVGMLILSVLLLWVDRAVGWPALLAPWREFATGRLLLLFGLSTVSYLLRAVRVYDYLHDRLRGRFLLTLRLSVLHNFANNLLPMRTGEVVFPLLMKRYFGHGVAESSFSLLWIRAMDLHFLAVVAFVAMYLHRSHPLWLAAAAAWLALPIWVFRRRGRLLRWSRAGTGRVRGLLATGLSHAPARSWCAFRLYGWTSLSWTAKFLAFAAVLMHFVPIPPWQALWGVIGAELSSVLPVHGVAGSGSYELATVVALAPLGVSTDRALEGAVNLHLFLLGVTLILGAAALLLPGPESARHSHGDA